MTKHPFTVAGYTIGEIYSTFCEWTWAANPKEAIKQVGPTVLDPDDEESDFVICAVLLGHHEDIQPDDY